MTIIGIILVAILIIKSVISGVIKKIIGNIVALVLLITSPYILQAIYSSKGTHLTVMDELGSRVVEVPNGYFIGGAVAMVILFSYGILGFMRNSIFPKKLAGISALIPALLYLGSLTRGTELYIPLFKPLGLILAVVVFVVCGGFNLFTRKKFL